MVMDAAFAVLQERAGGHWPVLTCLTGTTGHCRSRAVRGLCAPAPVLRGLYAPALLPNWHDRRNHLRRRARPQSAGIALTASLM